MKKKHKNGCNILIMTFTYLEKYVYSKKCLKQGRQPPPPSLPHHSWLRLLFAIACTYPADNVTKRSVYRSL